MIYEFPVFQNLYFIKSNNAMPPAWGLLHEPYKKPDKRLFNQVKAVDAVKGFSPVSEIWMFAPSFYSKQ